MKNLLTIGVSVALLIIVMSGVLGACSVVDLDGSELVHVNGSDTLTLRIRNTCSSQNAYNVWAESDIPVDVDPSSFKLNKGVAQYVELFVDAAGFSPGLYELNVFVDEGRSITQKAIVLKVSEQAKALFLFDVPQEMRVVEHDVTPILVGVRNAGRTMLRNVVVSITGDGLSAYSEPFDLPAGQRVLRSVDVEGLSEGEHELVVSAWSGVQKSSSPVTVTVVGEEEPIETELRVEDYKGKGYAVRFKARNMGFRTFEDLYVTVDDAPPGWEVISPSAFDLAPGEVKEVEVVLLQDSTADADVSIALYEGMALLHEEEVKLSRAALGATGLVSLATSLKLGVALLAVAAVAYVAYRKGFLDKYLKN